MNGERLGRIVAVVFMAAFLFAVATHDPTSTTALGPLAALAAGYLWRSVTKGGNG